MAPEASSYREFLRAGAALVLLFSVVFYGADYLAGLRAERLGLYLNWELGIPFLPQAYALYFSVLLLPFLVPVLVPTAALVRGWRNRMAAAIAIAGVAFLLFPAELGYRAAGPEWAELRQAAMMVAGRYNLVPSLHVALTLVTMYALWPHAGRRARLALLAWGCALALSTLLTHQHHLLDVATGLLLGFLVCRRLAGEVRP